jgi:hypothetical protein
LKERNVRTVGEKENLIIRYKAILELKKIHGSENDYDKEINAEKTIESSKN